MDSYLHDVRVARGLSREELAAKAGLSARTVFAIEREDISPQRATRRVLALALDLEVDDLFPPGPHRVDGRIR